MRWKEMEFISFFHFDIKNRKNLFIHLLLNLKKNYEILFSVCEFNQFFFILSLLLSFFIEWNFTHNQQNLFSTWIFALQPTTTTMIQAMFLCVYMCMISTFFLHFFFVCRGPFGNWVEFFFQRFFSTLFFCFFDMILTICIKIKNKTLSSIYYNGKNFGNVCSHTHTGLYSSE